MTYSFKTDTSTITVDIKGTARELIPAVTPLVIDHTQEYVYAPVMTSTATLGVYGGDYLKELYADNVLDHYVRVTEDGAILWEGYITQNVYSQDFSADNANFEIECIDVLSAFKLLAYQGEDFPTFLEMIQYAFAQTPDVALNNIYVQKVVSLQGKEPLANLSVAAANWFDEADEPTSLRDVIEEIAKYLCMSFVYEGGNLYLIDRTSDVTDFWTIGGADVTIAMTQTGVTYKGTNQTYSIKESKNKITLTNSLYEVESIFADIIENKFVGSREDVKAGDANSVRYRRFYETDHEITKVYHYARAGGNYLEVMDVYDPNKVYGAQMIKYQEVNKASQYSNNWERMLHCRNKYQEENNAFVLPRDLPIFETTIKRKPIAWKDVNICFSARVRLNSSIAGFGNDITRPRGNFTPIRLQAQISIGKHYWDGTKWGTDQVRVSIPFKCDGGKSENMCENWFPTDNNNKTEWLTPDLDGYTMRVTDLLVGDLKIVFYRPYIWNGGHELDEWAGSDNGLARIFTFKDIRVNWAKPDPNNQFKDEFAQPQDRIFEEIISDIFDSREHAIELLMSTAQGEGLAKSYVMTGGQYVGEISRGLEAIAEIHSVRLHREHFKIPRVQLGLEVANFGVLKRLTEKHTGKTYAVIGRSYDVRNQVCNYTVLEC